VWFVQQRSQRYVFHLSGKQRAACGAEGPWQGPPGVGLVLIGQQAQQLQQGLAGCVAGACSCSRLGASIAVQQEEHAAAGQHHHHQQQQTPAHSSEGSVHAEQQNKSVFVSSNAAAAHFAQLVQQHYRFELVHQQQQQSAHDGSCAAGLVQFTALGSPLHGVVADEVRRHTAHST
jgi:hypothetical protein